MNNEQINKIINSSIDLIEKEVQLLCDKEEPLSKPDSDKVIEYLKALVLVQKDARLATKEKSMDVQSMTSEELDNLTLEAAEEIKRKRGASV